jgi:hypothetical protein
MDSQIFTSDCRGQTYWIENLLILSKMGLHDPFGYLKHKLWPKEGLGIKLPI